MDDDGLDLLEVADPQQREALQASIGADEALDELGGRVGEDGCRGVVLRQDPAALEDRDSVGHLDRLVDVMGDEDDGLADLFLEAQELVLKPSRRIGSTAPNGSSISITGGSAASARATPTRCRSPPDSSVG